MTLPDSEVPLVYSLHHVQQGRQDSEDELPPQARQAMICALACPLPKIIIRRVPKNAQDSYICTFEHINID